jgi:hypothetical protein
MSLVASEGSGAVFTPAPEGTHPAVCCQVIDIGHQFSKFYGKTKHKVLVGWELPEERDEEGKPFMVWQRYTLSLHENSQLRAHLEAWRGKKFSEEELKGFHLKNVLGAPCLLNITHEKVDKKTYPRVQGVMSLPRGTPKPKSDAKHILFDIEDWDQEVFDGFRENLQKTIEASEERKGTTSTAPPKEWQGKAPAPATIAAGMAEDDIPF